MKILLSIKPQFAEKILDGKKRFEFRKITFDTESIKSVVIYATKPVGKVVGEFEVNGIYRDTPSKIWAKTKKFAGIDKVFFDEYYEGREVAVAIGVGAVQRYETPLELSAFGADITPPQSFRYLTESNTCDRQGELQLA
jgi:predicted transcriptional regulator